jgi:hypothetical protein
LEILTQKKRLGPLRSAIVRDAGREVVGWYLYYANAGGTSEVVQVGGAQSSIKAVLQHLFHDAWRNGSIALSGQLDPGFMHAFSETYCMFRRDDGDSSVLVHSKDHELLEAVLRGDAFLTRLEGEWWIV